MGDPLTAVAAEAKRDPAEPILVRAMHGRTWRFGPLDVRPSRLRRYAALAEAVAGKSAEQITNSEAMELAAIAEEMLRHALPAEDRNAFDEAPFGGNDIGELAKDYFAALGVTAGESVASPVSSSHGRRRSRRTSKQ